MFHFVNYTSSPEPVAESSADSFSAMCQSAPSSWKATLGLSCSSDNGTDSCPGSPSGMMFGPLKGLPGGGESMSSVEASPARTFQSLGGGQASPGSDPAYGLSFHALLARFDRDSSSWKIPQLLLFADSGQSLETWPHWGSMRNGVCLARTKPALFTEGIGFGFSVPTPRASQWKTRRWAVRHGNYANLENLPSDQPHLFSHLTGQLINPEWLEWLMGWPVGWAALKPLGTDSAHNKLPWRSESSTAA